MSTCLELLKSLRRFNVRPPLPLRISNPEPALLLLTGCPLLSVHKPPSLLTVLLSSLVIALMTLISSYAITHPMIVSLVPRVRMAPWPSSPALSLTSMATLSVNPRMASVWA